MADLCACHLSRYATCSYPGGCGSPGGCCDPAARLCATCAAVRGLCGDDCGKDHKHRRGQPNQRDDRSQVCGSCRVVLGRLPQDIVDAAAYIPWLLQPSTAHGGEVRSRNPDPPMPLSTVHDLVWQRIIPTAALAKLDQHDQVGHPPIVSTLWWRIQDILSWRDAGENGPDPTIGAMCRWLAARTDWIADHYPAVDEYAAELVTLRGLLTAMTGRHEPCPQCGGARCQHCHGRGYVPIQKPQPLPGVPCPRCRRMSLSREPDGDIACGWEGCNSRWRPDEYDQRQKAVAKAVQRGQIQIPRTAHQPLPHRT